MTCNGWDTTVNQHPAQQPINQAQNFFRDVAVPENMQTAALQGVATSKEFFSKATEAMQDGTKIMIDMADSAWSTTKMLNDKIVRNMTANTEAIFSAAQAMATAKSLPEIASIQSKFVQKFAEQASEQTKDFFELSTRATQHMIEQVQAAASKSFNART